MTSTSAAQVLSEEVETLQRRLEELEEWCPEQSCRGGREAAVAAVWRRVSRLRRCTRELATRSRRRVAEWIQITDGVSEQRFSFRSNHVNQTKKIQTLLPPLRWRRPPPSWSRWRRSIPTDPP